MCILAVNSMLIQLKYVNNRNTRIVEPDHFCLSLKPVRLMAVNLFIDFRHINLMTISHADRDL